MKIVITVDGSNFKMPSMQTAVAYAVPLFGTALIAYGAKKLTSSILKDIFSIRNASSGLPSGINQDQPAIGIISKLDVYRDQIGSVVGLTAAALVAGLAYRNFSTFSQFVSKFMA